MSKFIHAYSWKQYKDIQRDVKLMDKNVYYYTTTDSLKKIMETGCLFASHIKYMNDWQEFNSGYDEICKKIIRRLESLLKDPSISELNIKDISDMIKFFEQGPLNGYHCKVWTGDKSEEYEFGRNFQFYDYAFPQVYNISFTYQRDLLSQWKMYAKESGIAIEFDFNKCNTFSQKIEEKYYFKENKFPQNVIYKNAFTCEEVNLTGLEEESIDVEDVIKNLEMVPYIKNQYYDAEKECRLIFRPFVDDKNEFKNQYVSSEIKFRESNHVLIPYLEIFCLNENEKISWPIMSLTVGPGNNQDVVFSSIKYFVEELHRHVYDFTVEEYIDNFEKYYKILLDDLKREVIDSDSDIILSRFVHNFKKEVNTQERINEHYSNGKFRHAMYQAKFAINEILERQIKENKKEQGKQIMEQFYNNNYLASNGIIIRKSDAPYLFN